MGLSHSKYVRTTADALHLGASIRYFWKDSDGLATVTEKSDEHVFFEGPECDGWFTHEQINTLIDDGRLEVVLDSERHDLRDPALPSGD